MRLSASVTLLWRELPLLDRFAAARRAGFRGVEIQRLHEGDPAEMARAARDAGVQVVLVNCGMADYVQGGLGLSGVPGCEAAFQEAVASVIEAAAVLGARHIHLGPSRIPEGVGAEACRATYLANIRTALALSRALAASLVIEAMNAVDAPTALVTDIRDAHRLARAVDSKRLGLLFDVYHIAMAGGDPVALYRQLQGAVRHVQFADAPGRHEPGTGTLDIAGILTAIHRSGYAGWFGAEYVPAATTKEGLGWCAPLLNYRAA
jgi:hydroxypyruvate isomerase